MLILEENFKCYVEAFASELFIHINKYIYIYRERVRESERERERERERVICLDYYIGTCTIYTVCTQL